MSRRERKHRLPAGASTRSGAGGVLSAPSAGFVPRPAGSAMTDDAVIEIAALLAGDTEGEQPPPWLIAALPALVETVRASRRRRRPRLREMRDALSTMERAAGNLANALKNPDVLNHLAKIDPSFSLPDLAKTLGSAPAIARQAGLALGLVAGRDGETETTADAPALDARTRCAAIVSEAWQAVRERREGPKSDRAYEAAELLWRAAGGVTRGKATASERWRPHVATLEASEALHPHEFEAIRSALTAQPMEATIVSPARSASGDETDA